MLFLKFQIGADEYLLDTARVIEVLPLLDLKRIPGAALGVAGVFNYRGVPTPVVDLSALALGMPAARSLSTRLILVHYPLPQGSRALGLVVEKATETIRRERADFAEAGITSDVAPYLGPVAREGGRLLQWIEVESLLPAAVSEALFREAGAA